MSRALARFGFYGNGLWGFHKETRIKSERERKQNESSKNKEEIKTNFVVINNSACFGNCKISLE
jgi:hypothetical protein